MDRSFRRIICKVQKKEINVDSKALALASGGTELPLAEMWRLRRCGKRRLAVKVLILNLLSLRDILDHQVVMLRYNWKS